MKPHLYFFHPGEFNRGGEWFSAMSPRLLVLLDTLRLRWERPIRISRHPRAVGRHDGDSESQHNYDIWDEVRAVDVIPDGLKTKDDAYAFFMLAADVGFTGIGFYPDWSPSPGFHLDVRHDRRPGFPATWGRVGTEGMITDVSLNDALEVMG